MGENPINDIKEIRRSRGLIKQSMGLKKSKAHELRKKKYGYQSNANPMDSFQSSDKNEVRFSKDFSSSRSSFLSWDTIDIEEEREYNSKYSKYLLMVCIFINIFFNLWLFSVYLKTNKWDKDFY
jgi:hypothetical protein